MTSPLLRSTLIPHSTCSPLRPLTRLSSSSSSSNNPPPPPSSNTSASSFLAKQALQEEQEEELSTKRKSKVPVELREGDIWDGEETRERMLKRILNDQYKPLRIKGFKKIIPKPSPFPSQLFSSPNPHPSLSKKTKEPDSLVSTPTPKQPWEYDQFFKPPENYQPALGYRSSTSSSSLLVNSSSLGSRGERNNNNTIGIKKKMLAGKEGKESGGGGGGIKTKRREAEKLRIFDAYEKTLDYKGGVHKTSSIKIPVMEEEVEEEGLGGDRRDLDGSRMAGEMRVYEGFIEEKIKKAREQGLFKNIKGRGKPIPKDDDESNPFISRDDFLINRILKTQDAAPPWIELQKELEHSLSSFRSTLSTSWIRRAIRIRSSEGLTKSVIFEIEQGWRDIEWEQSQRKFHETALKELNQLTRRFNIIAPYHVRRPLLNLNSELVRTVSNSSDQISKELSRRLNQQGIHNTTPSPYESLGDEEGVRNLTAEEMGGEKKEIKETMWKAFRRVLVEILGKTPDDNLVTTTTSTRTASSSSTQK